MIIYTPPLVAKSIPVIDLAGAGAALLFAPASGTETRERVASELGRVKEATVDALRDVKRQAPAMLQQIKETARNEVSSSSSYNT